MTKRTFAWVDAGYIAAGVAFVLFVDGAAVNARGYYVKGGVYAGAGVLALATAALGITSFAMLRSQPADAAPGADVPDKPVLVSSSRSTGSQYSWAIHKSHSRIARGTTPRPSLCNLLITTGKISPLLLMPSPPAQANGSHAPIQQSSPEGGTAEQPRRRGSDGATAVPASTSTRPTAGTESYAAVPC